MPLEKGQRGQKTNQLQYLQKKVLTPLWKCKGAYPFHKPVDATVCNLDEYYDIIKSPMDMDTIKERLAKNFYHSSSECISDFHLMFKNCETYNKPGEPVFKMCENLKKVFLQKLKGMPPNEVEVQRATFKAKGIATAASVTKSPGSVATFEAKDVAKSPAPTVSEVDCAAKPPTTMSEAKGIGKPSATTSEAKDVIQTLTIKTEPGLKREEKKEQKKSITTADVTVYPNYPVEPVQSKIKTEPGHERKTEKEQNRKTDTTTDATPADSTHEPAGSQIKTEPELKVTAEKMHKMKTDTTTDAIVYARTPEDTTFEPAVFSQSVKTEPGLVHMPNTCQTKHPKEDLPHDEPQHSSDKKNPLTVEEFEYCCNFVKELQRTFQKPLDAKKLGLHDVITMDLNTVKDRLEAYEYSNIVEFKNDVRLIFSNTNRHQYMPEESNVVKMVKQLQLVFESKSTKTPDDTGGVLSDNGLESERDDYETGGTESKEGRVKRMEEITDNLTGYHKQVRMTMKERATKAKFPKRPAQNSSRANNGTRKSREILSSSESKDESSPGPRANNKPRKSRKRLSSLESEDESSPRANNKPQKSRKILSSSESEDDWLMEKQPDVALTESAATGSALSNTVPGSVTGSVVPPTSTTSTPPEPKEPVQKRPRGRPRKDKPAETGPKRPRGRPRKDKPATPVPKRPRGRPRKVPLSTPNSEKDNNRLMKQHEQEGEAYVNTCQISSLSFSESSSSASSLESDEYDTIDRPMMNTYKQEMKRSRYIWHVLKNIEKSTFRQYSKIINIIREQEPHLEASIERDFYVDFARLKYSTLQKIKAYGKSCKIRTVSMAMSETVPTTTGTAHEGPVQENLPNSPQTPKQTYEPMNLSASESEEEEDGY